MNNEQLEALKKGMSKSGIETPGIFDEYLEYYTEGLKLWGTGGAAPEDFEWYGEALVLWGDKEEAVGFFDSIYDDEGLESFEWKSGEEMLWHCFNDFFGFAPFVVREVDGRWFVFDNSI